MISVLRRVSLKLWAAGALAVTLATSGLLLVGSAIFDAFGADWLNTQVTRPIVRSALAWLFSTPPIVPTLLYALCALLLFWLVRSSLKTDIEFQAQAASTAQALAVVSDVRELVMHRANFRRIEADLRAIRNLEVATTEAATRQDPNPQIEAHGESSRARHLSQTLENARKVASIYVEWPVKLRDAALAGKDLSQPFPIEDEVAVIDAKRHDMRITLQQLKYAEALTESALEKCNVSSQRMETKFLGLQVM